MTDPAPTRRERRKLWRALRKLRKPTDLVDALNRKAQLQAQRRASLPPEPGTITRVYHEDEADSFHDVIAHHDGRVVDMREPDRVEIVHLELYQRLAEDKP